MTEIQIPPPAKAEQSSLPFFMSPSIDKLATALAKAQGEMKAAVKDSTNPHFKSKYADLAAVWEACREPLSKNGLSVVQLPRAEGRKMTLIYLLLHSSGQYLGSDLAMTAMQDSPQGIMGAITYARRGTLAAAAGISQDDDDGNAASGKPQGAAAKSGSSAPTPEEYAASRQELAEAIKRDAEKKNEVHEIPFGEHGNDEVYTETDAQKEMLRKDARAVAGITESKVLRNLSAALKQKGVFVANLRPAIADWVKETGHAKS